MLARTKILNPKQVLNKKSILHTISQYTLGGRQQHLLPSHITSLQSPQLSIVSVTYLDTSTHLHNKTKMVLGALIKVIGVAVKGLSMLSMGDEKFAKPSPKGTTITIAAALDQPAAGFVNAGGSLPSVRLYNEVKTEIGSKTKKLGKVGNGATESIFIEHKNGQQASYALFSAGNDAVCVAYVTITWASGEKYAWTGDWAGPNGCNNDWYYSNIFIEGGGKDSQPTCLWIDRDGNRELTGFHVHFPSFVTADNGSGLKGKKVSDFCNTNAYRVYKGKEPTAIQFGRKRRRGISGVVSPDTTTQEDSMQSQVPGNATTAIQHKDRLIVTDNKAHKVKTLCDSASSKGPDMVNTAEGLFCRMKDHTLWPVCKQNSEDNCFNMGTKKLVIGGKSSRSTQYAQVGDWTKTST